MRILPIQNYNNKSISRNNKPAFQSWEREVFVKSKDVFVKELKHRNDTSFFRDGRFWSSLAYYMMYKYRDADKVGVYNYACSDGSEPYSLLMTLISIWGIENVKKYLPIKAKVRACSKISSVLELAPPSVPKENFSFSLFL